MLDTSNEYFDIVDENDIPLGVVKPRDQVHKELVYWHRVTVVWVLNDKNQFLCQQRSFKKDVHPGMWILAFGGHVKSGETYDECLANELDEELGLSIDSGKIEYLGEYKNHEHLHHSRLYILRWNGNIKDLNFNDGEVEQVKLVTLDEYQEMIDSGVDAYRINPILLEYVKRINDKV